MCARTFARCHFKPLWIVMSNLHRAETKVTVFLSLAETQWQHDAGVLWVKDDYSVLQGNLKWKTDYRDGPYLSNGLVRVSQTQRRWSCACPGLHCAGFLSRSALMRQMHECFNQTFVCSLIDNWENNVWTVKWSSWLLLRYIYFQSGTPGSRRQQIYRLMHNKVWPQHARHQH